MFDNDQQLTAIAAEFGTPTYVYDLDAVTGRLRRLQEVMPDARIRYAVKANASAAVLSALAADGAGVEAITLGELTRALKAGVPAARILIGGPAQGDSMREAAVAHGAGTVSLDSVSQWRDWQRDLAAGRFSAPRFLVRVNPALDPRTHEHLATGSGDSKFGMAPEVALALARELAGAGLFEGYHVHAGSQIGDLGVFRAVLAALGPLYDAQPGPTLDIGGGYRVPDFPLAEYASLISDFTGSRGLRLIIEPGRYLVAEAGVLLTRVLHVKEGEVTHVIADAGMADLLRPALYGASHPLRVVAAGAREPVLVDLDGPLCENADRLGRDVLLASPARGDLLAVGHAGAYGFGMASNYASSLRPAEVVVSGGVARLARRREEPADLVLTEVD